MGSRALLCVVVLTWGCGRMGYGGLDSLAGAGSEDAPPEALECEARTPAVDAIFAGSNFTCAKLADGSVSCWGGNESGQLGDGTRGARAAGAAVANLSPSTSLMVGSWHSCSADDEGEVRCWGRNDRGQLGTGDYNAALEPLPVRNPPASVTVLAGGSTQALAIDADGELWTWGAPNGTDGQWAVDPVAVGLPGAVIAASGSTTRWEMTGGHSCAVLADGTVWCWGANAHGQLGDGTTDASQVPVQAQGIDDAIDVTTGDEHTCVLKSTGRLECWGDNDKGQLGDGTTAERASGVEVPLANVVQVAAAGRHTCAVDADGAVTCWGDSSGGQSGALAAEPRLLPGLVEGLSDVVTIAVGPEHACALRADHTMYCWGSDRAGQLGLEVQPWSLSAAEIAAVGDVTRLAQGRGDQACVVDAAGELICWGGNQWGQAGDFDRDAALAPHTLAIGKVQSAGTGPRHSCAVMTDGSVTCWGDDALGKLGVNDGQGFVSVPDVSGAVQVALGMAHTCALLGDGTVWCWGHSNEGKTGTSGTDGVSVPAAVPGISSAAQVVAGRSHTCVLLEDGTARCFGRNNEKQSGNADHEGDASSPLLVDLLTDIAELAAGAFFNCARVSDGTVWCWGDNRVGQLGRGGGAPTSVTPEKVDGITDAVQLSAGANHACALIESGRVWCWGDNDSGQLGDGTTTQHSSPVEATALAGAVEISAAASHTCARFADGRVECVGSRVLGQLGTALPAIDPGVHLVPFSCAP